MRYLHLTMTAPENITWHCKPFEELTTEQLYHIIALREEVFIVEQNCPYQDADGKDFESYHVWAEASTGIPKVLAYARIVKRGVSYPEAAIGRVVASPKVRRMGLGKELVKVTLKCVEEIYGDVTLRLSAQSYLLGFYCGFGFEVITEPYMEDGIPHVGMIYHPQGS